MCLCVFAVCVQPLIGLCLNGFFCMRGVQRANDGNVDSLMPPLRNKVQGQITHCLYHTLSLCPFLSLASVFSTSFIQFSLPVG